MRQQVLKMSVSVDGFLGGPNGEVDWVFRSLNAGATEWTVATLWDAGLHLMGSRTFEDMPLFANLPAPLDLELAEIHAFAGGAVATIHRPRRTA